MDSWMLDNFEVLARRRLHELVLPGTHDSQAYALSPCAGPVSPSVCDRLLSFLACFAKPCIAPWTVTQHVTVYEQLAQYGSRFLDVRVVWDASHQCFVTSHTFSCAPLKVVLFDIMDFLTQCTGEVVVLLLRPDWVHRDELAPLGEELLATVTNTCSGFLFPRQSELPMLSEIVTSGRRLLVFVEDVFPAAAHRSSPSQECTTVRANPSPALSVTVDARCADPNAVYSHGSSERKNLMPAGNKAHSSHSPLPARPQQHPQGSLHPSHLYPPRSSPGCPQRPQPHPPGAPSDYPDLWVSAGCRALWANSDTPGGTVSGLLDLLDDLRRTRRCGGERGLAGGNQGPAVCRDQQPDGRGLPGRSTARGALCWYLSAAVTPTPASMVRDTLAALRAGRLLSGVGLRPLAAELEAQDLPRLLAAGLQGLGVVAVCLDHPSLEAMRAVVQLNLAGTQGSRINDRGDGGG